MSRISFDSERVFPAEVKQLDTVQEWVESLLEAENWPSKFMVQISVVVEELFVNIASYAYDGGPGEAVLRISVSADAFCMQFEDSGKAFNPLDQPELNTEAPLAERRIGGMGIFIARKTMTSVDYRREDGRNILTIQKTFKGETV